MNTSSAALILAAGEGRRMHSSLPKILHTCGELPLICHVVALAMQYGCCEIVVVVSPKHHLRVQAILQATYPNANLRYAIQTQPLGTGDAARVGLAAIPDFVGDVLVLYGDVPLLSLQTLQHLQHSKQNAALAFLTTKLDNPYGYGRVIRNAAGKPEKIVEQRDLVDGQQHIQEINAGVYMVGSKLLTQALAGLQPNNAQHEIYLTDIVAYAAFKSTITCFCTPDSHEVQGVNSRADLAIAEHVLTMRLIKHHQAHGVMFHDPDHTFVGMHVVLAEDVDIGMGVQLRGRCKIAAGTRIEGPTILKDCHVGMHVDIRAFSYLEGAIVGDAAVVGPFARLRPKAELANGAHVGNFVEVKNSYIGAHAKANHLAYLGDATIGAGSNIGAGTVTCNYDGVSKHQTAIGERVFVGSNSTLVAPVVLEDGVFVAAGSTLTDNVPQDALVFGRARQVHYPEGASRLRQKLNKQ